MICWSGYDEETGEVTLLRLNSEQEGPDRGK